MDWLKKHADLLVAVLFAALLVVGTVLYELPTRGTLAAGHLMIVSDGFFVAGILLGGMGVLTLIAQMGGFDGLAYIFYNLGARFNHSATDWKAKKEYADFKRERQGKDRAFRGLLQVGLACLGFSAVFAFLFYHL